MVGNQRVAGGVGKAESGADGTRARMALAAASQSSKYLVGRSRWPWGHE